MIVKAQNNNGTTRAYFKLENALRDDIISGRLAGGQPVCTEAELSQKYAISRNSVRRALDNLVEAGLLRKVKGSGTFVIPAEERTRKPGTAQLKQILFLTCPPVRQEDSFAMINNDDPIIDSIGRVIRGSGYELVLAHAEPGAEPPAALLNRDLAGVIFHGIIDRELWRRYIAELPHIGIQYIDPTLAANWVKVDNYNLCYQAIAHLYELGHRNIGFVTDEIDMMISQDRFLGYITALKQFGLAANEDYCITWQRPAVNGVLQREFSIPDYSGYLKKAFSGKNVPPPTAFVCADDWRAICTINALSKMGYSVPGDISITGVSCGGQFSVSDMSITSLSIRLADVCQKAAEVLLGIIMNPYNNMKTTVLVRPELYRGCTSATLDDASRQNTGDQKVYRNMAEEFIRMQI